MFARGPHEEAFQKPTKKHYRFWPRKRSERNLSSLHATMTCQGVGGIYCCVDRGRRGVRCFVLFVFQSPAAHAHCPAGRCCCLDGGLCALGFLYRRIQRLSLPPPPRAPTIIPIFPLSAAVITSVVHLGVGADNSVEAVERGNVLVPGTRDVL